MTVYYPQARMNLGIIPRDGSSEDLINLLGAAPLSVNVEHNDIFTADTFEVEIQKSLFPMSCRDVRAANLDIYIGDVGGVGNQINTVAKDNRGSDRVILGQSDKISEKFDSSSGATVRFEGRDYSGILLDEKWQGRKIALGRPISEIVKEIAGSVPALERSEVLVIGEDLIVPGGVGRKRKTYRADADLSLWEAIIQLAMRVGAIVTMQLDLIVIQPPRNLQSDAERLTTPLFVEGQNLEKLTYSRTTGASDVPNILVQAMNPSNGAIVEGRWPKVWKRLPRATQAKERVKKTETQEFKRFVVKHPAPTVEALNRVARRVYEFLAREQVTVSFETRDMAITKTPNVPEFDKTFNLNDVETVRTTAIRNGTQIRVKIDPAARGVLEKPLTRAEKERELREQGYRDQVAFVMAEGFRTMDELLFVSRATHSYSVTDGYGLSVEAINTIEVTL